MSQITWDEFSKIEIRTGTIVEVRNFPEAIKPAYKMKVDMGEKVGIKTTSAQITNLYQKKDLLNKQVLVVINLPPKKIGPFTSECCTSPLVLLGRPGRHALVTGIAPVRTNHRVRQFPTRRAASHRRQP